MCVCVIVWVPVEEEEKKIHVGFWCVNNNQINKMFIYLVWTFVCEGRQQQNGMAGDIG